MGTQLLLQFSTDCFETLQMFLHEIKMCIWFWYNTLIILSHFFCFVNLVYLFLHEMLSKCIDSGYPVGATPPTVSFWLFWNLADIFCMEWRCACGLGIILWLFFLTFSALWTSSFLLWNAMKEFRQWVSCRRNSSYSFSPIVLKLCNVFYMVWRCACGFCIIYWLFFLTFSALWT